jgi:hypothetical protein
MRISISSLKTFDHRVKPGLGFSNKCGRQINSSEVTLYQITPIFVYTSFSPYIKGTCAESQRNQKGKMDKFKNEAYSRK